MSVFALLFVLAILGLIAWSLCHFIPMPAGIQKLIYIAAVVIGVLYVLHAFGIGIPNMVVPQIK